MQIIIEDKRSLYCGRYKYKAVVSGTSYMYMIDQMVKHDLPFEKCFPHTSNIPFKTKAKIIFENSAKFINENQKSISVGYNQCNITIRTNDKSLLLEIEKITDTIEYYEAKVQENLEVIYFKRKVPAKFRMYILDWEHLSTDDNETINRLYNDGIIKPNPAFQYKLRHNENNFYIAPNWFIDYDNDESLMQLILSLDNNFINKCKKFKLELKDK
jgi:hypothetical protein